MEQTITTKAGGSWAHRMTPEMLIEYRAIAETVANERTKGYMLDLCKMMDAWFQTPDFTGGTIGVFGEPVIPLPKDEITRIWDVVPWEDELRLMDKYFSRLTDETQINAAKHLAWYAWTLANDRQPCTKDCLPAHMQ